MSLFRQGIASLLVTALASCQMLAAVATASAPPSAQPTAAGRGLAASSLDVHATSAAIQVMQAGGNAVDGAVAASAMIGVTAPYTCGIGGGGFLVIYLAGENRVVTLDHRETAPWAITPTAFLGPDGQPIPYSEQVTSGLSVGVPGLVRGWEMALSHYGRLTLADDLKPAIHVADEGFAVNATLAAETAANADRFRAFASTRDLFLGPGGGALGVGSILRNPDLANTYRLLAQDGARAFYRGPIAQAIVDTVQNPPLASGGRVRVRPGLMQLSDLAEYEALTRAPVVTHYRHVTVYGMDLPSSGGPTVGLALNLLDGFDLASMSRPEALHRLIEAERLAFADRNAYMADPAFVQAPLGGLLSSGYAAERRQRIGPRASGPVGPGDPSPFDGNVGMPLGPSRSAGREGTSTTHITVADAEGNVVAYTCTIEEIGGSGMAVPGYGFLLNNELTDFDDAPTGPNAPDGGKRPRSSMSPTLIFRDDQPLLALGSPGGPSIITTVLQVLVNVLDFGMDLPSAVAAPRLSQRNLATTAAEPALSASPEGRALVALGHRFVNEGLLGAVTGIAFNADGSRTAVAEPRRLGGGAALVVEPPP